MDRLRAESTVLSILCGTTAEDAETRAASLRRFCEQYTAPLVTYLHVSRRIPLEEAEDLVHDFWTQKLLVPAASQNIVAKYFESNANRPGRGFRQFIFRSLVNFHLDQTRKTQRRGVTLSLDQLEGWQPANAEMVDPKFDLIWARHILGQVVEEVRQECEQKGQHNMWRLFVDCISRNTANDGQTSMSELSVRHGFDSAKHASTALITISRKFDRVLKSHVANYLPWQATTENSEALRVEVAELRKILAHPGTINIEILELHGNSQDSTLLERVETENSFISLDFGHQWVAPSDLASLWQAMLEQRLAEWLPESSGDVPEDWNSLRFCDLANWTNPHLAVLRLVHQCAKRWGTSTQQASLEASSLPKEICSVIYLTAIAVAYLQLSMRLSKAPGSQLAESVRSAIKLPWLDSRTQELLSDFHEKL